jgi:uncharacterized protein with HEPN domain
MSKDKIKAEFILEMIERIEKIVKRHGGIVNTLNDFEGEIAVLMAIAQIGETLKKIDDEILERFDLIEDKEGAYYTRNYIVHDYEGVNLAFIKGVIRQYMPKLKNKMFQIIDYCEKQNK